jgi:hypothetical protein
VWSAQRDRGLPSRALPRWTSGPGDQAEGGPVSVARPRPRRPPLVAQVPARYPLVAQGARATRLVDLAVVQPSIEEVIAAVWARRTADPTTACPVRQRVATWQPDVE